METQDNSYSVLSRFLVNNRTDTNCYSTMISAKTSSIQSLSIVSWNIGGKLYNKFAKGNELDTILKLEQPSILAIQETQSSISQEKLPDNIKKPNGYTLVSWGCGGASHRIQTKTKEKNMNNVNQRRSKRLLLNKPPGNKVKESNSSSITNNNKKDKTNNHLKKAGRPSGGVAIWINNQVLEVLEPVILFESSHFNLLT